MNLIRINKWLYEVPRSFRSDMRVPARIFMSDQMVDKVLVDHSLEQIVNVTTLPGIQKFALAMPDIHEGYGFPIGGVAAMAIDEGGVISPGGIGYDINCGVRLLASNLPAIDLKKRLKDLAAQIYAAVPSGVGRGGPIVLDNKKMNEVLKHGARAMLKQGIGTQSDLEHCEELGCYEGADPSAVSDRARERGNDQLGTLGSGNHFLEIQVVDKIFDEKAASAFGLQEGCATVMIHCGSRGLGHQICTDYVSNFLKKLGQWDIKLADRELACAPFKSPEGQAYFAAMKAAANFAWANRHTIAHNAREVWRRVLGPSENLSLVYDVAHNIGKLESHSIDGQVKQLIVHRKGATRAFGPGAQGIPADYQHIGQPVLIPGTMGTASYVLVGTKNGMAEAFGSSCHGAGRAMSRMKAKKTIQGSQLRQDLLDQGILVFSDSNRGLAEEAPIAYKDIEEVVEVTQEAGLARRVARLRPLAVIKGD